MITPSGTILAVDDDKTSLLVLSGYLRKFGFDVVTATSGAKALEILSQGQFDLLISDLRMPGMDGLSLLEEVRKHDENLPFIIITACGSIESAVSAIRRGAIDYLEKPYSPEKMQLTIQRAIQYNRALSENRQIKEYLQEQFTFQKIITTNTAMKKVLEMAAKVTPSSRTTVAIYGESGTGKEVLARAIHFASTGMLTGFVAVNCAAIPENLIESELFGHVKGAFTGADKDREGKLSLARKGTLLLDEIGDMPLSLQAKLLRALQERNFEKIGGNTAIPLDCRVIVATNMDLAERVAAGAFREDLYHRINVFPLQIPPLRERKEDIPQLCCSITAELQQHLGKTLPGISSRGMEAILNHQWPGNIRELRNRIERAAILTTGGSITPEHLGFPETLPAEMEPEYDDYTTYNLRVPSPDLSLTSLVRQILAQTLELCSGNKSRAAELLKIDRKMFYRS